MQSMRAFLFALALIVPVLAGCIGFPVEPDLDADASPDATLSFEQRNKTGALLTEVETFTAEQAPLLERLVNATGTYYETGWSTFEPTIGSTSTGGIFTNSYAGLGSGALVLRSMDQGQSFEDVTPRLPTGMKAVPNSNDPFIYVDPFTDRVYDFDMCVILQGFCVAWSDDDGETWMQQGIAHGFAPALDHQSMAAAPDTQGLTTLYENVLTFCVNRGTTITGAWCSSSFDGGIVWTPLVPGFPVDSIQCSGLHGHVKGSPDGTFYRGNPSCDGPAVYRSADGGQSWTEHTITTETGMVSGIGGHEVAVATDSESNVYAFWIGEDGLPYLSWSTDQATTWADPVMVGAPGVTAAGFPALEAGSAGRAAWTYIGTDVEDGYDGEEDDMQWSGYIGISVDLLDNATIANVPVNHPDDPLDDEGRPCGAIRCGGFGDFVSITIDSEGRPWAALAHNPTSDAGIVGTLITGPSLRHGGDLSELPLGDPLGG